MTTASSLQASSRFAPGIHAPLPPADSAACSCDVELPSMRDAGTARPVMSPASPPVVVADRSVAWWQAVDADLSPVIGQRATQALHARALCLTRASVAWLPEPMEHDTLSDCLSQLHEALAARPDDEAAAATRALEQTFHDLLASLMGAGLTARLLRSARAQGAGGGHVDSP